MLTVAMPPSLSVAAAAAGMMYGVGKCWVEGARWWAAWARRSKWVLICCVCVGLWTDLFLTGFTVPLLPFMLEDRIQLPYRDAQPVTAYLLAIFAGARLLFAPVIGAVAERVERKKSVMLWALGGGLLATWGLAVTVRVWVLYVARLVQGICGAVVWIVGFAVIAETVGQHNMGHVMGFVTSFMNSGSFCGPVIGGWLLTAVGYAETWKVAYGVLLGTILIRLFLTETPPNVDRLFDELGYEGNQFGVPIGSRRVPRRPQPYGTTATHRRSRVYDSEDLVSPVSESSSSSFSSVTSQRTITHERSVTVTLGHHHHYRHNHGADDLFTHIPNAGNSSSATSHTTHRQAENRRPLLQITTSIVADPMPISTLDLYKTLFTKPCFLASMISIFVYAVVVSAFDATMPLFARQAFGYDGWDIGRLLFGLQMPGMLFGVFQGGIREWWGVRWPATIGFASIAPLLVITGVPGSGLFPGMSLQDQEAIFRMCLLFIGAFLAITTNSSMTECTFILDDIKEEHPNMFGRTEEGVDFSGYSRLYAICTMVYTLGTLVGPLLAGFLVVRKGYFVMNCVLAGLSVLAASTSYLFILDREDKPFYHRRAYVQGIKEAFFGPFGWVRPMAYP